MLKSIKAFFTTNAQPSPEAAVTDEADEHRRIQIAACAMLLELAHADDTFSPEERRHIEGVMVRHFDLSPATAKELMALAEEERKEAVDLFQFANLIATNYSEGQRMVLAEAMWGLVHADGKLSGHEDYLMHKFASLLELRPGYLSEAKNRALKKSRKKD